MVPSGFNVGNPGLSAERTWNYEAGLDYQPLPALTLRSTYFNRYGRNLIDYVAASGSQTIETTGYPNLNPNATYRLAENLFAVTTQGIETEVTTRAQLRPACASMAAWATPGCTSTWPAMCSRSTSPTWRGTWFRVT